MDPVRATLIKYQGENPLDNLMGMNYTCHEVCSAFGHTDQFSECRQSCAKMIRKVTDQKYSVDYRDLQQPVIWDLSLHYLPSLLDQGMSVEEAKTKCMEMCKKSRDPSTCMGNCVLDYNAVDIESYEKPKKGEEETEEDYALCGCTPTCPCRSGNCNCIYSMRNDLDEEEPYEACECSKTCPCRRNQCTCIKRKRRKSVSILWWMFFLSIALLAGLAWCQQKL